MRVSYFPHSLTLLIILLSANGLTAQNYVTTVRVHQDSLVFSTPKGNISQPDSITISAGRIGGRFHCYFEGKQAGYFKFTGRVWKKVKRHHMIQLALVFSPPASFRGEAHAKLRIQGISGNTWKMVELVGRVD